MFSVIIPLYNKERHIRQCIESVLNQDFELFEIILINDGSTDEGLEIVKSIKSEKLSVHSQSNQGVSVARNEGAKLARYDYLIFLDADDGLMPSFMYEISSMIDKHSDAAVFATNFFNYKMKFDVMTERSLPFLAEETIIDNYFQLIQDKGPILASVTVISNEAFQRSGGFVKGMVNGEDTHLLSKILLFETLCFLNKPLYYRTYDSDNKASEKYKPATTDISLLDYLGSGVNKADEYIITYSLWQVKKLIKSGYKNAAMTKLDNIVQSSPEQYLELIEQSMEEINALKKWPHWYFKNKRKLLKYMVVAKDILKFKFNLPV